MKHAPKTLVKEMPKSDPHETDSAERREAAPPRAARARSARVKRLFALTTLVFFGAWLTLEAAGGPWASVVGPAGRARVVNSDSAPAFADEEAALVAHSAVAESAEAGPQGADYSRFNHTNPEHARLPCLLCHRRADNSPRPTLPGHQPCAGCHQQQFAEGPGPVCSICHTRPEGPGVKSFPPLKTFNVRFDHARHNAGGARPREGCAACHRPLRGGVALSIPAGFAAHSNCYQCHTPRAQSGGRDISSCGACHEVGRHRRTPTTARAFAVGFSHAAHRKGLGCADCHSVRAGAPQGRQVTSPQPSMHHASPRAQSCMTCHNDRRAFGGDDFRDCTRCHKGGTWAP
jgi:c(7)-type cytochrome triheme protein